MLEMLWNLKCLSSFSHFKRWEMAIGGKPFCSRPSTVWIGENVENVREIILENRRQTIEEVEQLSGVT